MLTALSVTVENLAEDGGLYLTPFFVAAHDGKFDIGSRGARANRFDGLEALAEGGDTSGLLTRLAEDSRGSVGATIAAPDGFDGAPVFEPGESVTQTLDVTNPANNRFFSFASMVIPSNDAFVANLSQRAHTLFNARGEFEGPLEIVVDGRGVFDAGTERNSPQRGAAFSANGGTAATERRAIRRSGDLDNFVGTELATGADLEEAFSRRTPIAKITIDLAPESQEPVTSLDGLGYSLQNYFNAGGELTPFFDQLDGTVGSGIEIEDSYIYGIDFSSEGISMEWNTDPQFDGFEPYVGFAGGLSQEDAAAAGITDEYHFTFDRPVSHLVPKVDTSEEIVPVVRFEDENTLVIAIPGGTDIGDGRGLSIELQPRTARSLRNLDYSLQNYFNAGGDLAPFFDQQDGTVGRGREIQDYIYTVNLSSRAIVMQWNKDPQYDSFEPYVGFAGGLTQEQAAETRIADEYHFTFDEPVSHLVPKVASGRDIQPDVRFEDDHTLVIAIPGGTPIGDGKGLKIRLEKPRPVRSIKGLDFSLQNYFNAGGDLTPFFDQQNGTVGRGREIEVSYIYDINLSSRAISMEWNTDPQFDGFEPYVGFAGGLTQEEAAAASITDEYHFTFSEPVSHLVPRVDTAGEIIPLIRFEDDHTLVIAIPGGTEIGDGNGLKIRLLRPWLPG